MSANDYNKLFPGQSYPKRTAAAAAELVARGLKANVATLDYLVNKGVVQQRDAFLDAATGDAEEVLPVRFREPAVAFGDVGRDGKGRPVQLVGQEEVAARELLRQAGDLIGEVDGFLVNLQILEHERHGHSHKKRREQESS
jgi:hypothetical protein